MLRLWLKICALLIVLCVVSMGAAMAVAYVQGQQRLNEIRAFLEYQGFYNGCFFNICSGKTSYEDVLDLLEHDNRIKELSITNPCDTCVQKVYISYFVEGYHVNLEVSDVVLVIDIFTNIRFYEFYSVVDEMYGGHIGLHESDAQGKIYTWEHSFYYFDALNNHEINVFGYLLCNWTLIDYWQTNSRIRIYQSSSPRHILNGSFIPLEQININKRDFCNY